MTISRKLLISASLLTFAFAANAATRKDEAPFATPEGITVQPLGKAQGYDMGKQTASVLFREELAFADAKGMTLYTFDKDAGGKSACNGPCATNWPPLKASASDKNEGGYTMITRDDGSMQWAYKGKPLYTWAKDTKPGDITGDGFNNGVWHIAQP